MEPLFFGPDDHSLFGWLHLPAGRAPRRTAVVLCHPFGQEFVLAHRAFHGFARLLAEAGFATLRFDWWGTGDSQGDLEEARLETWTRDVALAMRTVRERVKCDDVALAGMRLGGTLAALAGADAPLAALLLWDPVVDGATFLRGWVAHWREQGSRRRSGSTRRSPGVGLAVGDRLREGRRALDLRAARDRDVPVQWGTRARRRRGGRGARRLCAPEASGAAGRRSAARSWSGRRTSSACSAPPRLSAVRRMEAAC
jgi:alpha-beta hydrolase superfamily lysophospholipase